jgi:hypothetical protein
MEQAGHDEAGNEGPEDADRHIYEQLRLGRHCSPQDAAGAERY